MLGVKPALGRGFRPDEDQVLGRDAVVVLAHEVWKDAFGGDLSIVGRHVRLGPRGGLDFTVIGVTPEAFTGMDLFIHPEFFIPAMMGPRVLAVEDLLTSRSAPHDFNVKGRLKSGVSIDAADADIAGIAKALEASFPDSNRGRGARVRTELQSRLDAAPIIGGVVAAVSGIMTIILVIACANVANLTLGRGRLRGREISVRLAIGAGRLRLVRQLMAESLVIAFSGGALGLFIATNAVAFFSNFDIASDISIKVTFQLDNRVLLFTMLISAISAVLVGLIPSLQATRANVITALKAGESELNRKRFIGRNALVTVQIAGSLVMLTAAQMYRNTSKALTENPGFTRGHRLTVRLDPALTNYNPAQTVQFHRTLLERVRGTSGIRSATLASGLPLTTEALVFEVVPEGYEFPAGQENFRMRGVYVDEDYFTTFGVPVIAGRSFRSTDRADSPRVAIINQEFARRAFNGNALGKRIRLDDGKNNWAEIVGVTTTGKYSAVTESPAPHAYLAFSQNPASRMTLIAETSEEPSAMARPIRDVIHSIDPNMPVIYVRTMEETFQRGAVGQLRVFNTVFTVTSLMGFILAVVGLYAIVAFQVSRRTREIGIRMALGARRSQVSNMIVRQASIVAFAGIGIGFLLSVAARPALLVAMGRPVSAYDPVMISLIPTTLLLITLIAAAIPAHRAAQIDPQRALRQD